LLYISGCKDINILDTDDDNFISTYLSNIEENFNDILQKHYKHYRKVCGLKPKDLDVPGAETGKQKFVDELKRAERRMAESGYSFAGNPVLYRPNR